MELPRSVSFALAIYTLRTGQQAYKKSHYSPEKSYLNPTKLFDREKPRYIMLQSWHSVGLY